MKSIVCLRSKFIGVGVGDIGPKRGSLEQSILSL